MSKQVSSQVNQVKNIIESVDDKYGALISFRDLENLTGKLLTYIDATYQDREQRNAHKSIIRVILRNWYYEEEKYFPCKAIITWGAETSTDEKSRNVKYEKSMKNIHLEKNLWRKAKYRAKSKNLEFNISLEDIIVPENCGKGVGFSLDYDEKGNVITPEGEGKNRIRIGYIV